MKLLYAEFTKLKNTFALWLTLLGALFIPLILFGTYMSDVGAFVPENGISPWDDFLVRTLNGCCFFSVGFILLIIGLIIQIEHRANAWKHLFSLPISKCSIYLSKLVTVFFLVIAFFTLYLLFSIISGLALGYAVSNFGFLKFRVPGIHLLRFVSEFLISILPMLFLQFWLSFRLKNLITSLGIGLGGLMIGLLLKSWTYIIYLPYAAPFQLLNYKEEELVNRAVFFTSNAIYTVLFVGLSYRDFTRKFRG